MQNDKGHNDVLIIKLNELYAILERDGFGSYYTKLSAISLKRKVHNANFHTYLCFGRLDCIIFLYNLLKNLKLIESGEAEFVAHFSTDFLISHEIPFKGTNMLLMKLLIALEIYHFIEEVPIVERHATLHFCQYPKTQYIEKNLHPYIAPGRGKKAMRFVITQILIPLIEYRDKERLQIEDFGL